MHPEPDILQQLFEKASRIFSFDEAQFTIGTRYVAALNKKGQIGVCATLNTVIDNKATQYIDFTDHRSRVIANAFINATLNYIPKIDGHGDIFDVVDFSLFKNTVMIGYFDSLVQKLQGKGIAPVVFDIDQHEAPVMPMVKQKEYLSQAQCVILTSTSLGNKTFQGIIDVIPPSCSVYMLGPSTPIDDLMFTIPQVKGLFGSLFPLNHAETLKLIAEGCGTKGFMHNMQKVYRIQKLEVKS